jgi:hypothetical protein
VAHVLDCEEAQSIDSPLYDKTLRVNVISNLIERRRETVTQVLLVITLGVTFLILDGRATYVDSSWR